MKLTVSCPRGKYNANMQIICDDGQPCAFQYFKSCKGWWVQTKCADDCVKRKEGDNNGNETGSGH